MATTVTCVRCGQERAALPAAPWPGEDGEEIRARVCASCWQEWQLMQTKVINEYRLNLSDPRHQEALDEQMRLFLHLAEPRESSLGDAPYGFGEGGPEGEGEQR